MPLQRREVLATGIVALCGCTVMGQSENKDVSTQGPTQWETYGRLPTHQASYEDGTISPNAPSTDQSIQLNGSVATSPVATSDYLTLGDERGLLIIPSDKQEIKRWVDLPGMIAGTPCFDNRKIYAAINKRNNHTDTATISAITVKGKTVWQKKFPSNVMTMPTFHDDILFVRSKKSYLALDSSSGKIHWQNSDVRTLSEFDVLSFDNFGPAVGNDVVIFPDSNGITALDPTRGTIRWRHQLQKVRSCPVIADGMVYVADVKSGIHAFDVVNGNQKWVWSGKGCWSPPVVSNGTIYATEIDDVIAIDQKSGDLQWRTKNNGLHGAVQSGISVIGNTVLASSASLGLVSVRTESEQFNKDPGTIRWMLGKGGFNTPIVVGDQIVFVEYGGDSPILRIMK